MAGAFEFHAAGVVTYLADGGDFLRSEADVGHFPKVADLVFDEAGAFAGFLDESGDDAFDRALAEIQDAGEFE